MDLTLIVAKVLAVYFIVSGVFLIVRGKTLPVLLRDFFAHPAVVYLTGAILVFLGALLLVQYNVWDGSLSMLVTIVGWLVLLKGLTYIFVPHMLAEIPVRKFRGWLGVLGAVLIVLGVFLFRIG